MVVGCCFAPPGGLPASQEAKGEKGTTHHAACSRTSSHHRYFRPRAGESRFLCGRARNATRQTERQSGRPRHVSPLLCRRGRASGHGPDVLPLGPARAAADWPRAGQRGRTGSAGRQPGLLGRAPREIRRHARQDREALRRYGAHAGRPARVEAVAGRAGAARISARSRRGTAVRFRASVRCAASTARRSGSAKRRRPKRSSPPRLASSASAAENGWTRYGFKDAAGVIDIKETPDQRRGAWGVGAVHHLAWRVDDEAQELVVRAQVEEAGGHATPVIDRFWFKSVYFKEPGGVLFETRDRRSGLRDRREAGNARRDAGAAAVPRSAARAD